MKALIDGVPYLFDPRDLEERLTTWDVYELESEAARMDLPVRFFEDFQALGVRKEMVQRDAVELPFGREPQAVGCEIGWNDLETVARHVLLDQARQALVVVDVEQPRDRRGVVAHSVSGT